MVNYIWYTRDYVLVSSESPMIQSFISFCPFCGKHIGSESLHQEYYEACDQAAESDSSFPDFDDDSKMEEFRIEFLIRVESQEKTQNL